MPLSVRVSARGTRAKVAHFSLRQSVPGVIVALLLLSSSALSEGVRVAGDDVRLNRGTPWQIAVAPAPLAQSQRIVTGYEMHSSPPYPEVVAPLGTQTLLRLSHEIDVANQISCGSGGQFRFALTHRARISLRFDDADAEGSALAHSWQALDDVEFEAGNHTLPIDMRALGFGSFVYTMDAESQVFPGASEQHQGLLMHTVQRRDHLPLAHPIVHGVDLYDGGLSLSRVDIDLPGRGPGLRFSRSYASHRGGDPGELGLGWTHNYAASLQLTGCGEYIVRGADGQSMSFVSTGYQDGREVFRGLRGYHGSLYRNPNDSFDFHPVGGTRYHFVPDPQYGHRLAEISDTNGNRVTLEYETRGGERVLSRVVDDAERELLFEYRLQFLPQFGSSRWMLHRLRGPGGIEVAFERDERGALIEVARGGNQEATGGLGMYREGYEYLNFGTLILWENSRPRGYYLGDRLSAVVNLRDGATQRYQYQLHYDFYRVADDDILPIPTLRVVEREAADLAKTRFTYVGERGLGPVDSVVRDPRQANTRYRMDRYGAAHTIEAPNGTRRTEWDPVTLKPAWEEGELGTRRSYVYDQHGNPLSETLVHASGTQQRSWTWWPEESFSVPGVRNRMRSETDYLSIITHYAYDHRGNRTSVTRGGISETYGYNQRGDLISETDGTDYRRLLAYDGRGLLIGAEDILGLIERRSYDVRV